MLYLPLTHWLIAVDLVQEHVFKQGDQSNESAIEQAKDEAISDAIRDQYKKMTGKEFMIPDKSWMKVRVLFV